MSERTCSVLGHRMVLDPHDTLDLAGGRLFESTATSLLPALVSEGDIALDVGANIGYYTLLLARLVGPAGLVYAFEPEPESFALLQQNVALNGYRNVRASPAALGAKSGRATLWANLGSNRGDHRLYDPGETNRRTLEVEVIALDDVFREGELHIVKLDIQGGEPFALRGMRRLLARSREARVLTEFWPFGLRRAGIGAADYLAELREVGFGRLLEIDEEGGDVRPVHAAGLLARFPETEDRFTNLLCLR